MPQLEVSHVNMLSGEGFTALHWAIEMGQDAVVECLLKDGRIDHTIKDKEARTGYQFAKEQANNEIISIFEKYNITQ